MRINISITEDFNNLLNQYKNRFNVSKICRKAIMDEIHKIRLQDIRAEYLKKSIKKFCNSDEITFEELRQYFIVKG